MSELGICKHGNYIYDCKECQKERDENTKNMAPLLEQIEKLGFKIEDARDKQFIKQAEELSSMRASIQAAMEALLEFEYKTVFSPSDDNDDGVQECPWCFGVPWRGGHREKCKRQEALKVLDKWK